MDSKELSFIINGIGPHYAYNMINSKNYAKSAINIAIYAENGKGKTFISRCFALDESKDDLSIEDTDRLLSLGRTNGEFSFSIKEENNLIHSYSVELSKGSAPKIRKDGNKKLIYHVFNSDYVERNIIEKNYSPDGNIEGYIIGQANIDVSNEKALLANKQIEKTQIIGEIESKIRDAKNEIKRKGISSALTEFKNINYDNVFLQNKKNCTESYDLLNRQYTKLKSIPESVPNILIDMPKIDLECLKDSKTILETKYDITHFDEETMKIIESVKSNPDFFDQGLSLYKNQNRKECPFCHQNLNDTAMYYLDLYRTFFSQAEAQVINDITKNITSIKYIEDSIDAFFQKFNKLVINFEKNKEYIPEFADVLSLELQSKENMLIILKSIKNKLLLKKENIENTNFETISNDFNDLKLIIENIEEIYTKQYNLNKSLQSSLNNTNNSRLSLIRKICNVRFNMLTDDCKKDIDSIKILDKEIDDLSGSIKTKEGQAKTEKREVVKNDLKKLLDYFFHNKYTLDENTFGITFLNNVLNDQAKHVLSDGEKSIVAFCYYLATTHTLINNESDYDDLFFIFDDPISSMDFKYVYVVADIIRGLKNYFPQIQSHARYIVLTHNAEFMSILCRNKIAKVKLHLKNGNIEKLKEELLMPYEHHLIDLVSIANKKNNPNHTTPNSIRQVIETIMHFEAPFQKSSEQYIKENEILNKNAFIYSLMQDGSHGVFIKQPPITDDDIIDACKVVVDFVKTNYPRQFNIELE